MFNFTPSEGRQSLRLYELAHAAAIEGARAK